MTNQAPSPLRLALVITELEVGGAERCLVRLGCGLHRDRFAPEVYCLQPRPQSLPLVQLLEAHNVPVHFLGARGGWSAGRIIRNLNCHLHRQQPHVVQSFLFHANLVTSCLRRGPWRTVFGVRVADPRRWRLALERQRSRRAEKIVCVSQNVADYLQQNGFDAGKLVVIPNGIDAETFAQAAPLSLASFGVPQDAEVLLFLGRLEAQKGVDWLLSAIHPVLQQRAGSYLVLAGRGDWEPYRALARDHAERIVSIGWQPDVAGLLRRSALLILPSRWEGMPNVVLEAMASGVPVLATDVQGVREVLGAHADSQVVSFGDSEAFASRALRLLSDTQLRAELMAANQDRALRRFSVTSMIAAYEHLYLELARR